MLLVSFIKSILSFFNNLLKFYIVQKGKLLNNYNNYLIKRILTILEIRNTRQKHL